MLDMNCISQACQEEKLRDIVGLCQRMTSERHLATLLNLISLEAKAIVDADRLSIFLLDKQQRELWSVATPETQSIRFGAELGVAGAVVKTRRLVNVPDAYQDARFCKEVDRETEYRTKNLLAVPLTNTAGEIIGVCEALNRRSGSFDGKDEQMMELLGPLAAHAVETVQLIGQLEKDHRALIGGLRNVIEGSVVPTVKTSEVTAGNPEQLPQDQPPRSEIRQQRIKESEKRLLLTTLEETNGNKDNAAVLLGISTRTLYRKLAKFQLHHSPNEAMVPAEVHV